MKVETILFILIFVFASLICLAYNQEGFVSDESEALKSNLSNDKTIQGLDETLKKISDFTHNLQGIDQKKISSAELNAVTENLSTQVSDVSSKLSLLISRLDEKENRNRSDTQIKGSENLADSADVKASQIIQDDHIKKLKDRLAKLQNNIGRYIQTKNEKKYPKIPVYSSCVISEASGSYSLDPNNIQGQGGPKIYEGDSKVVPSVIANNPFKDIGNMGSGYENQSGIDLESILNGLLQKDVQINFNIPEN